MRFDFGAGLIGYSDFLPWPLYGEKNLRLQLEEIQKGIFSQRFLIARRQAFLDAKARLEKRSLFFSLKVPASHFLIENLLEFQFPKNLYSFNIIKVKLQNFKRAEQLKILKELNLMLKNVKWRLDLNQSLWRKWESSLSFLKEKIDFIEDPQDPSDSALFAEDWSLRSSARIKIVKPSRDSLSCLARRQARWKRIVFTHSFDHPLGQVASTFWAGLFYKSYPCFFETGAFLNFQLEAIEGYEIESKGANFISPKAFGFGFSKALKNENWQRWL